MFDSRLKQAQQLLGCFKDFQVTDLVGFAMILGVEEEDNFIDFCTKIINAFCLENRIKRKQLLKLAKDIQVANKYMVSENEAASIGEGD